MSKIKFLLMLIFKKKILKKRWLLFLSIIVTVKKWISKIFNFVLVYIIYFFVNKKKNKFNCLIITWLMKFILFLLFNNVFIVLSFILIFSWIYRRLIKIFNFSYFLCICRTIVLCLYKWLKRSRTLLKKFESISFFT